MASERQILANRANAAKSTGPVTKAGKRKAAANSVRHGMLARTIVLDGESRSRFAALLLNLVNELQPRTEIESALVENMAVARWRQMRLWAIEKAGITLELEKYDSEPANQNTRSLDASSRVALAFRTLSDHSRSLDLITRYEARYDRQYAQALQRFFQLREKEHFCQTNPI